ncbi:uncharacterized protein LOC131614692 [Vicia villosa]|uniref:uncharacterized protein LOC131614692 n=1 Tax=Vicia villosa TaxID=3911 RepID=UPI00273CB86A|nr:uncharacterized protein LOC131614692 [Vicia villosa]
MGCDVHVVVPPAHKAAYYEKFALNSTYTVSNFKVQPNKLLFKPSTHKYLVKFTGGTSVSDVNKHEIQPKQRKFTRFADIITGKYRKDLLLDVIGMVESIGYAQTQTGGKKLQVNLVLRDESNNTINCTLWESYAAQFFNFNKERGDASNPTILVLQYAKVKEEGQYPLSVTNTFHVTRLCINENLPAMKNFLDKFPKDSLVTVSSQLSSQYQRYSQNSNSDTGRQTPTQKLLEGAVVLPISEIKKLRETTFCATVAETKKLIASSFGWYYQACYACPKAIRGDHPPYKCDNNHKTETEIYRYKIEIDAAHAGVACKFIFWDRECTEILKLSAAQMRETMIKVNSTLTSLPVSIRINHNVGLSNLYYPVKNSVL